MRGLTKSSLAVMAAVAVVWDGDAAAAASTPEDQICIAGICMTPAAGTDSEPVPAANPPADAAPGATADAAPPASPAEVPPPAAVAPAAPAPQALEAPAATATRAPLQPPPLRPPPAPPPSRLHAGRRFMALPFFGAHSYRGASGKNHNVGVRLGSLLGARINQSVSLNGEVSFDLENPENEAGVDSSSSTAKVALAPLLHSRSVDGSRQLVVGFKMGLWANSFDVTMSGQTGTGSSTGWLMGLNLGWLFDVGDVMALGLLAAYEIQTPLGACSRPPGGQRTCYDSGAPNTAKLETFRLASLSLAAMF
jgi:hypothetical protein